MLKKPKRIGISIDMTPMVDIAFLLLIFFMATTVFKPPEKDTINLPQSQSDIKTPEGHVIVISVTPDNRMSIEYRAQGQRLNPYLAHAEDLRSHLRAARVASPRAYILVKADEESSYGMMQDVMTILQEENATRFNIVTEREATGVPAHSEG